MKSSMYRCTLSDGALPGFMPLASCLASLYRYLIREDRLEGFGRPKPNLPSEREGHRSLGFPTRGRVASNHRGTERANEPVGDSLVPFSDLCSDAESSYTGAPRSTGEREAAKCRTTTTPTGSGRPK